jgi:hypothetical protein
MKEWNVDVRRTVMQRQTVHSVEAETAEEARRKAVEYAKDCGKYDFWEDVDEVRPTNASRAVPWPEDPS